MRTKRRKLGEEGARSLGEGIEERSAVTEAGSRFVPPRDDENRRPEREKSTHIRRRHQPKLGVVENAGAAANHRRHPVRWTKAKPAAGAKSFLYSFLSGSRCDESGEDTDGSQM